MIQIAEGTPVCVKWYDTIVSSGWEYQLSERRVPILASLGFWYGCYKGLATVASSYIGDDIQGVQIPIPAISTIRELRKFKKGDKKHPRKIVIVEWTDSVIIESWIPKQTLSETNATVHTLGVILQNENDFIHLVTSASEDDEGLITVIPKGSVVSIQQLSVGRFLWRRMKETN